MTSLRFDNVVAGYDGATILDGISLEISPGERVAVLGRNGVGKTTMVNTMLGITKIMRGAVTVGGKTVQPKGYHMAAKAGIAIVPQGRRILPNLTVRENLELGAAVARAGHWTLDGIFDLFPILRERAGNPGTALSGGQQQMLAIGRALMGNPSILVLDEPSEGLAPVIVDELAETLNALADRGTGILLIEQNIILVGRTARRFHVLSKGRFASAGQIDANDISQLRGFVAV